MFSRHKYTIIAASIFVVGLILAWLFGADFSIPEPDPLWN